MANLTDKFELKQNGFIYEATEPTSAAMAMLPQNRTLLVAELTDTPPAKPASKLNASRQIGRSAAFARNLQAFSLFAQPRAC